MSWKYPKRPIRGTHVVAIDAINENLLTVSEESSGYLNEHNFKGLGLDKTGELLKASDPSELIATRQGQGTSGGDKLPEDIAYRIHYNYVAGTNPNNKNGTNWVFLDGTDFFQTVNQTGMVLRGNFRGSLVWICASFTLHSHQVPAPLFYDVIGKQKGFGFNVGILVDGAIVPESIVGSTDITQENFMTGTNDPKGGGGINGARNAVVVDAVVYVPPGAHTFEIGIQDIRGSNYRVRDGSKVNKVAVSTCEFFALEMMR
tara:strand:- start:87 stop:863 length:777 start_codon:yes stop_codon:yes gene_type:complete